MSNEPPRVRFIGTYQPSFARIAVIEAGLRCGGLEVEHCSEPAWGDTRERMMAARRGLQNPGLALRLARAYARLAGRLGRPASRPDVLLVPYPGQLDVIILRAIAPRTPIVLDAFVSLDETLADRQIGAEQGTTRRLARFLDRLALRLADRVVIDTAAHARRFVHDLGLDPAKVVVVPVGAADPLTEDSTTGGCEPPPAADPLRVLYFGGFIPLHGVSVILEAARRLGPAAGITFDLVGDGQEWETADRYCRQHELGHVRLVRSWMPEVELIDRYVRTADVCLGVFADRPKTRDVVPAKVYVALACGRPVLTGDTPAIREEVLSRAAELPLLTCRLGDPDDLAARLVELRDRPELRARLSRASRAVYEASFRPERVVAPLVPVLYELMDRANAPR